MALDTVRERSLFTTPSLNSAFGSTEVSLSRQITGKHSPMKTPWVFLIAFALVFYGTGAAFVESFVNYPSWHLIGSAEFTQFHRFISPRILTYLVAPMMLGTVLTILLLWFRPAAIPTWSVWLAIALQTVVWLATVAIQVPIQIQLGADGLSVSLIERLIETNFWLRRIPYGICAVLFLWMASRVLRTGSCDVHAA